MRKIKCDICGKEVVTSDPNEMPWSGYQFNEVSLLKRQVQPKSVDLCYDCSLRVWNKIENMKEDADQKECEILTLGQQKAVSDEEQNEV